MANQAILPTAESVRQPPIPILHNPVTPRVPIVPPSGSNVAGGPTHGQLFPVGNR